MGDLDEDGPRLQGIDSTMPLSAGDGDDCPYQGLAPFATESTELFFGRVQATRNLLARLEEHGTILLVSGASGVGKSSLLRAGLIPALANGMLPVTGSRNWPRLLITPTSTPLRALAGAWAKACGGDIETAHQRLRDDPWQALADSVPPAGRLILVIDQFEELFTVVTDEQERQAFVQALHAMAEGPLDAAVIIGLRADYWDRCAAYPQFAEAIQDGQVIVEPMTEPDLRLAITGPAAAVGLEIEPGLVETVLGELRVDRTAGDRYAAGTLPLLSQALRNTWDRRENGRLTIRGYEESGRVRDSVRRTADEILEQLPAEDRKTALKLFRRMTLITAGGRVARRQATLSEIHAAASAHSVEQRSRVDALLSAFAGRRLITLYEDTVEISHDALLTAWPTLRQWLEPDLTAQAVYDGLIDDAAQWAENHRDPAFLYRGARLLSVEDTRPRWDRDPDSFPPPGPTVAGFISESTRAARRAARRRGLVTAGLAVLSVLALIAAGIAANAANDADRQRAVAVSRYLAAQSELGGDPVAAALRAVAAWRTAPTAEARHAMLVAAASTNRGVLTGHESSVVSLAFSPDGTIIATGSEDGTARLWDTASRRQLGTPILPPEGPIIPPGGKCPSNVPVAFSPDGRMLASACLGTVRFWDVSTHRQLGAPVDHGEAVTAIAFGPDGTLATASSRATVRLWDVATRRPRGEPMGRTSTEPDKLSPINAVVFSPDGRRLATAGSDHTVRLWDTATHDQIGAPFAGHTRDVLDVSFSPDGTTLASVAMDGTARLWSLATHRQLGAALKDPANDAGFDGIAFSPDGKRLATAGVDGRTRLWDTTSRQPVGTALTDSRYAVRRVAFSPDGRRVAAADDDGVVHLADPVVHRQIGSTMPGGGAVTFSPGGRTLAAGGRGRDPAVRLWDVAIQRSVGRPLEPTDGPSTNRDAVYDISFGPGGRTLATRHIDGVRLWDVPGRRQIGSPVHSTSSIGAMKLSPDGRLLAIRTDDSVLFWDVAGRREIGPRVRTGDRTIVNAAIAISPDGTTLASTALDRKVRIFDVATRRQIGAPLPVSTEGFHDDLAFSPDGRTLAVTAADNVVQLWDLASRRPVGVPLTGHTAQVGAIAFSPDGKALVTGSADDTVRLWDLATDRQIGAPLTGHTRPVTGISYSPDGTMVATVSEDGTTRLWNVALPADPVATLCADMGRAFTRAAWERSTTGEQFQQVCR